jgi:hypothetical protein
LHFLEAYTSFEMPFITSRHARASSRSKQSAIPRSTRIESLSTMSPAADYGWGNSDDASLSSSVSSITSQMSSVSLQQASLYQAEEAPENCWGYFVDAQ